MHVFRKAKFKNALRVGFSRNFTKIFLCFPTSKFKWVSFPQTFQKSHSKFFSCQNRKSELSIDGLIIYVSHLNFDVGKHKNIFVKFLEKPTLNALLNFASLFFFLIHVAIRKVCFQTSDPFALREPEKFLDFCFYISKESGLYLQTHSFFLANRRRTSVGGIQLIGEKTWKFNF